MDKSRDKFLQTAAEALIVSSPAISSHLNASRVRATEAHDRTSCPACGTILVRGWSCRALPRTKNARGVKSNTLHGRKTDHDKTKRVECLRCTSVCTILPPPIIKTAVRKNQPPQPGQSTLRHDPTPTPDLARRTDTNVIAQSPATSPMIESPAVTEPASSAAQNMVKRRARNKKSTLRALLENRKTQTPATTQNSGFDLMDFMKT